MHNIFTLSKNPLKCIHLTDTFLGEKVYLANKPCRDGEILAGLVPGTVWEILVVYPSQDVAAGWYRPTGYGPYCRPDAR